MINRWVAGVFAALLTVVHIVVIAALGMATIAYATQQQGVNAKIAPADVVFSPDNIIMVNKLTEFISQHMFMFYVLGAFIVYVLVVGCLATLIAINQNLERLNRRLLPSEASIN